MRARKPDVLERQINSYRSGVIVRPAERDESHAPVARSSLGPAGCSRACRVCLHALSFCALISRLMTSSNLLLKFVRTFDVRCAIRREKSGGSSSNVMTDARRAQQLCCFVSAHKGAKFGRFVVAVAVVAAVGNAFCCWSVSPQLLSPGCHAKQIATTRVEASKHAHDRAAFHARVWRARDYTISSS